MSISSDQFYPIRSRTIILFAMLALVIVTLMKLPELAAQFANGYHIFNDTDDAMRLVQVRDFLAGQSWWDLTQYRLNPPEGSLMHWSRLIDVPIAGFLLLFDTILSPIPAEIVTRTILPWCVLVVFSIVYFRLCVRLGGKEACVPALVVLVMNFYILGQFAPGRIDHHDFQLLGVISLLYCVFACGESFRNGAAIGAIIALMMAIGIETLPFSVGIGIILVLNWIISTQNKQLFGFSVGLVVSLWGLFFATQPIVQIKLPNCDALGGPILVLFTIVAIGLALCAYFTPYLKTWRLRFSAAIGCGILGIVALALQAPQCLASPYEAVHPILQAEWLNRVSEAQPLLRAIESAPSTAVSIIYGLLGVLCVMGILTFHALKNCSVQRKIMWQLWILLIIAIATVFWQIRAIMVFGVISMVVACYFVIYVEAYKCAPRVKSFYRILALLPFMPAIAVIIFLEIVPEVEAKISPLELCTNMDAIELLAEQDQGLVWSSIDLGPNILAFTHHSVVAAPYHRNNEGNLMAVLMKPEKTTEFLAQMKQRNIRYAYVCEKQDKLDEIKPKLSPFVREIYSGEKLWVFERM